MSKRSLASRPLGTRLAPGPAAWQRQWHEVIFGHETPAGKAFDVALLVAILVSIAAVMLESVSSLQQQWGWLFNLVEWIITLLFTWEFFARLACVLRPARYVGSFFGIVDIVTLLPSYLELFVPGAQQLATIRTLRLLRVFRVLKLARHVREGQTLLIALRQTWPKITVFLAVLFCSIIILGTVMYLVESGEGTQFSDIPTSVYWAVVTMTTVGYGDVVPQTPAGKTIAAITMLLGYAIIIVPTGLFSAQVLSARSEPSDDAQTCEQCGETGLAAAAKFCQTCGERLG